MGALDGWGKNCTAQGSKFWTTALPSKAFLEANPVFYVLAQPWIDDNFRLYYPHPKTFQNGYARSEYELFEPSARSAYAKNFPIVGVPFICRRQEDGAIDSVISVLIMRGSVKAEPLDRINQNTEFFTKRIQPLYKQDKAGKRFLNVAKIVCGACTETCEEVSSQDLMYFQARTTQVLALNKAVRSVKEPLTVVGAAGALYYTSPSAEAIFSAEQVSAKSLVLA